MNSIKFLKSITILLWVVIFCLLTTATILEKGYGTEWVNHNIYSSLWLMLVWFVTTILSILYIGCRKLQKQPLKFLLHLSFILILLGAFVTWCCGIRGYMELHKNETLNYFYTDEGDIHELPFTLHLDDFSVIYYAGTNSPADYVSIISWIGPDDTDRNSAQVSMNKIFSHRNYRFYQSGYDEDEAGSLFLVYHDPWGIGITYTGYFLLLISMLLFLFTDRTYRRLINSVQQPASKIKMFSLLLLFTLPAAAQLPRVLPKDVAAEFGDLHVLYNGRVSPLQTLAKDFTVKLYGKENYKGFTPEQIFTGWMFFYNDWKHQPMIKLKGGEVKRILNTPEKYISFIDFRGDENEYRLEDVLKEVHSGRHKGNAPGILSADEKYNLIITLYSGQLMKIYPHRHPADTLKTEWFSQGDRLPDSIDGDEWFFVRKSWDYVHELVVAKKYVELSAALQKIRKYQLANAGYALPSELTFKMEKIYNRFIFFKGLAIASLTLGLLLFGYSCFCLIHQKRWRKVIKSLSIIIITLFELYITWAILMKWHIGDHIPMSNGPETMQFMAWCALLFALIFYRKHLLILPFGLLLGGLTLMVSVMGNANPQITQLVPVLASPLLTIHVTTIMIAYVLLTFMALNGITAIIISAMKQDAHHEILNLSLISRLLLYPAVFFLAAGIFIGAVWANVSWGRYWGWDPKEVWALITMLIYAAALHTGTMPVFKKPMSFHLFTVVAFLSVLITYFGVNYFLGGMHSYA